MTVERETVAMTDDDGNVIGVGCKLNQSQCDHDFQPENDMDAACVHCGQSVWGWAFMECP